MNAIKLPSLPSLLKRHSPEQETAATAEISDGARTQRDAARAERDAARQQRDLARLQRDDARRQRDEYRNAIDLAKSQRSAFSSKSDKIEPKPASLTSAIDAFAAEASREAQIEGVRSRQDAGVTLSVRETELLSARLVPPMARFSSARKAPPESVAFMTVANAAFMPGVEALLLSLLDVYPDFRSPIYICHDGTLTPFVQARLKGFYAKLQFIEPDMDWFDSVPTTSDNHKRIGKLGYMNMEGLALSNFDRVVLLDSDIIVIDDISELWAGDSFNVCFDCGDREYVVRSNFTEDWVFNSGVVSIPGAWIGPPAYAEFKSLIKEYATKEVCPALNRFADQKIWNIFLKDKPKRYLPINLNCNVKYLARYLDGQTSGISIIHFAGPKPWNNKNFSASQHIAPINTAALQFPGPWLRTYGDLMFRFRSSAYKDYAHSRRCSMVRPASETTVAGRKTCVMIGNGPSLASTDLTSVVQLEKFAFNWFILSDLFDEICPEHLVLGSHMLFGGWSTTDPQFPEGYLEKLRARRHRPVLWCSFYFKEYFEILGLDQEFEINYALFEKPYKRFIDRVGRFNPDIDGFLDDGRTGVISLAIPAAVSLGFERIVLVGCDSNYNQPGTSSKYFYDMSQHTSAETEEKSLTNTWTEAGRGQFVYKLVADEMQRRGIEFVDCTEGGALTTVPKANLSDFATSLVSPNFL